MLFVARAYPRSSRRRDRAGRLAHSRDASPDARPRILALWMNETNVRTGTRWMGTIVTSTNVASVEVRTESFSFTADRQRFGVFGFSQGILDVIPQYRRAYVLHVIARNTGGAVDERLVPITIR